MEGLSPNGMTFRRGSTQLVSVVPDQLALTGSAWAEIVSIESKEVAGRLRIRLGVTAASNGGSTRFRPYAQLWGHSRDRAPVPICWLSGITTVQTLQGVFFLELFVDPRWIARADAHPPFALRDLSISDVNVHIPFTTFVELPVNTTSEASIEDVVQRYPNPPISEEMRSGVRPPLLGSTSPKPTLVLTHGYCVTENSWQADASSFTDALFFLKTKQSQTNDAFALALADFTKDLPFFSMIAHSQGGLATVHMLNYYHTGLSLSTGGAKIQSVGSPYQGNSGAGMAASVISLFGFGCGACQDLTTDGAQLWLTGISNSTRSQVQFYTTQYTPGNYLNYCRLATNMMLKWPNDGICEIALSALPGASNQGNTIGQCHSPGMAYLVQTSDTTRNRILNSRAGRGGPLD
jgi:hypothetical protein